MNTAILDTSSLFLQAAASYFGVPPDQLLLGKQGGAITGVFEVQLTIALTPDDLVGITHRMGQLSQPVQAEQPDPVFVPDDPLQIKQLREDWAALTPAQRGEHKSFARYKAHREAEQFDTDGLPGTWQSAIRGEAGQAQDMTFAVSEGVGGRKVQHVDVAEEQDAVSELPAAVWVENGDLVQHQMALASGHNEVTAEWLIQVGMLTSEQKAKYCRGQS